MAAIVAATIAFAPIDAVHAAAKSATKSRPNDVQTKSGLKTVPSASKAAAPSTSSAPKARVRCWDDDLHPTLYFFTAL